jgi:hypothetical protein
MAGARLPRPFFPARESSQCSVLAALIPDLFCNSFRASRSTEASALPAMVLRRTEVLVNVKQRLLFCYTFLQPPLREDLIVVKIKR